MLIHVGFSTSPVAQCKIVQQNDVINPKENELIILSGFNTSLVTHLMCKRKDVLNPNENELILLSGFNTCAT